MTEAKTNDIKPIELRLLDEQVDIVLNALQLYEYNLEYMINEEDISRAEQLQVGEGSTTLDINKTEKNILNLIENNKKITQLEIAKILNLSENCIYRNLKSL